MNSLRPDGDVMYEKDIVVFGLFKSKTDAELAIEFLEQDGFELADISVLLPHSNDLQNLTEAFPTEIRTGATTGAEAGALVGGTLGILVGIGTLAVPGLGMLLAAGPVISALIGAGLGGLVGGLSGALVGIGVPQHIANIYELGVQKGEILVSVHAEDSAWSEMALLALDSAGAQHIAKIQGAGKNWRLAPFQNQISK